MRELEPGLWRMLPEAGVSTRDVQRLARENGLFFAPDPGASEQSQIGGNVATNAGGPHALKYGVTGAWVTGLEAVLAPGELVQIGGWARKDVAGYDVKDLLIGSEGTLGVITAVRLRLLPAREAQIAQVAFFAHARAGVRGDAGRAGGGHRGGGDGLRGRRGAGARGGRLPGRAAGGCGLRAADGGRRDARAGARAGGRVDELLGGDALAIDRAPDASALWRWRDGFNGVLSGVRGAKVSRGRVVSGRAPAGGAGALRAARAAPRPELVRVRARRRRQRARDRARGPGATRRSLTRARALGAELFALVGELGGSIAAEHGVGWLKRGLLEAQWDERTVQLHEQIKRAFDPKGLLNPGKKLRAPVAARAGELRGWRRVR